MTTPRKDPETLLQSELAGIDKNFSYWHRLASEGLVFVATNPDDRAAARLDLAAECERRAKDAAVNQLQVDLADGLLAAVEKLRLRFLADTDL